jgi:cytochrome c-type biogenesis protein CcmE
MSRVHHKRLIIILSVGALAIGILGGMLYMMRSELNVYMTPTEIKGRTFVKSQRLRVGGVVAEHSLHYEDKRSLLMVFEIKDQQGTHLKVHYKGVAPSLFKEGKGVIAEGQMQSGELYASMLLAKHDENYKPPGA